MLGSWWIFPKWAYLRDKDRSKCKESLSVLWAWLSLLALVILQITHLLWEAFQPWVPSDPPSASWLCVDWVSPALPSLSFLGDGKCGVKETDALFLMPPGWRRCHKEGMPYFHFPLTSLPLWPAADGMQRAEEMLREKPQPFFLCFFRSVQQSVEDVEYNSADLRS